MFYLIKCKECDDMYGGETGQKVCKRFAQHSNTSSSVREHCVEQHEGEEKLAVGLVTRFRGYVHRKCAEAVFIARNVMI